MKKIKNKFFKTAGVALLAVSLCATPVLADELSDLQSEKKEVQSQVDSLNTQLTNILSELDVMEEKAAKLGDEIEQGRVNLAKAQDNQKKQYDDMKLRVQYMYENREASIQDIFVTSTDMGELLSRTEYFQEIYDYDREELEKLDRTTKEIESLNIKLAADLEELEKQQEQAINKQNELNNLIASKESEVQDLDARIAEAQAEIARRRAAEEAARKAAEEAQRKAQEEARIAQEANNTQQSTQGTSNTTQTTTSGTTRSATQPTQSSSSGSNQTSSENKSSSAGNSSSNASSNASSSGSSSGSASGSAIVSTAYNYIGVPYVWGGTSPRGFDCSGLVQYVYRQNGISIPRTSGAQAGVGRGVSLSDAQPGDIVCYAGHVAIYIGGGKVIHSPYPGRSVEVASATMMRITTIRRVV